MPLDLKDKIPKIEVSLTSASFEELGQQFIDAGIMDTDAVVSIFMRLKAYSVRSRKSQARAKKATSGSANKDKSAKKKTSKQAKPKTKEQRKGEARLRSKVTAFTKIVDKLVAKVSDDAMFQLGSGTEASIKSVKDLSYTIAGPYGQRLALNDKFSAAIEEYSQKQKVLDAADRLRQANDKIANPVRSAAIHAILKECGLDKHESDASRMFFPTAQVLPKSKWRKEDLPPGESSSNGPPPLSAAGSGTVSVDYGGRPDSPHSQKSGEKTGLQTMKRSSKGNQGSTQGSSAGSDPAGGSS